MSGKVLVTGAARGIGKGIADLLAERGWKVAVCDINRTRSRHAFFQCDVSSEASVKRCVADAAQKLGGLTALVNNAGIAGAPQGSRAASRRPRRPAGRHRADRRLPAVGGRGLRHRPEFRRGWRHDAKDDLRGIARFPSPRRREP